MIGVFPKVGDMIDNRYLIERVIGKGGFSSVFQAVQLNLRRPVAIKVMMSAEYVDHVDSEEMTERFRREAILVASLQSPFTIRLFDFGITPGGYLYMVFEYVKGIDLADLVERYGRQPAGRTLQVLNATLSCLHEAHSLGVLHRDIKPGNIMLYDYLDYHDLVKVLDFGIAKPVASDFDRSADLTAAGTMIGTPRYMAPELIRGEEPTPMADIYSLGMVAYELLVGKKAIEEDDQMQIITRQLRPQSFRIPFDLPDVDPQLAIIVNTMLEKDRENRFSSVQHVLHELRKLSGGQRIHGINQWFPGDPSGVSSLMLEEQNTRVDVPSVMETVEEKEEKEVAFPSFSPAKAPQHTSKTETPVIYQRKKFLGVVLLSVILVFLVGGAYLLMF